MFLYNKTVIQRKEKRNDDCSVYRTDISGVLYVRIYNLGGNTRRFELKIIEAYFINYREVMKMIGLIKALFIIAEILFMPIIMAIKEPELGEAMFQQLVVEQIANFFK